MSLPEILIPAPMLPSAVDALAGSFTVHRLWQQGDAEAFLRIAGPGIRGMATSTFAGRVDARLFDQLPNLEIVASFGVGYDNIDASAAAERGIVVTNTPGVLDDEVADFTVGLTISTLRQIPQADRFLREGRWLESPFPLSPTLRGRRVGIVGLGKIGAAVARRLEAFDVPIAYHARSQRQDVSYDYHRTVVALAEASDLLIVIVPGGAATKHLIDAEVLAALGKDGVLINVSRGSVVDEHALISALQAGTILSAGLDVYDDEPRVPRALMDMPQTVLLPHIGSGSVETREAMGRLVVENLRSWFDRGIPLTPVAETMPVLEYKRPR